MKILKSFILIICITTLFSSCETYGDPDIKHSVIFPMSGEWIGELTSSNNSVKDAVIVDTYNTSDESTLEMWLRVYKHNGATGTTAGVTYPVRGKVNIDLGK